MPKKYSKPHLNYDKQIEKLKTRGIVIESESAATNTLRHINYYRLGIYLHDFEEDHSTHQLHRGTTFENVMDLYAFDQELRILMFDAIGHIEVSFRAQWAYCMSEGFGPHAHLERKIHWPKYWQKNYDILKKEIDRTDESFIKKQEKKYSDPTPNIWACSEIMSFGLLSRWFKCLRDGKTRKKIAHAYCIEPLVLESWMHHLCVVRNSCAHHSRLWNRNFDRVRPRHPKNILQKEFVSEDHRLFNTVIIILHLLSVVCPDSAWREHFLALLKKYPSVKLCDMGFSGNWKDRSSWK